MTELKIQKIKQLRMPSGKLFSLTEYIIFCSLLLTLVFIVSMMMFISYHEHQLTKESHSAHPTCHCSKDVDIVITWVNGSDPQFRESLNSHYKKFKSDLNPGRFGASDDDQGARYECQLS